MPWEIDTEGADDAERAIQRLIVGLRDLRSFWPSVVPLFIGWMRRQFETQGGYGGQPWAPLSAEYAAWKAARYPGRGILVAEGDLRQAASRPERRVTPSTLTLSIDWAGTKGQPVDLRWHQEGNSDMPARPLLFDQLPLSARIELEDVAEDYVRDLARRLGLR